MFNNSGIIYSKSVLGQEENEISRIFDTNLKGAMLVAQEGARHMAAAGGGAIINIVSTADCRLPTCARGATVKLLRFKSLH